MAYRKRSKFGNRKVKLDGYTFDSQDEARRYQQLCILEAAGEIVGLQVHPKFCILPGYKYVPPDGAKPERVQTRHYYADFMYSEGPHVVVEDVKGKKTDLFSLKWALVRRLYPQYVWRIVPADEV